MSQKDYYSLLWVSRTATQAEIKKAYKKLALEYHPDRNKWNKSAEAKFKEVNEAYQILSDATKRKQYDQFGSDPLGGFSWGNYRGYQGNGDFSNFGDIFSQFGWGNVPSGRWKTQSFSFDFSDLFWRAWPGGLYEEEPLQRSSPQSPEEKKENNLDVVEKVEIPFLDFLFDSTVNIKTVYGKVLSLKVKANTKPGTKFKLTGKGRMSHGETGDMYVIVNAKMPHVPDPKILKMIDWIRHSL